MSRGFFCSLTGIGMTLFAWYGPWEWPAWPAFAVLYAVFGRTHTWWELPFAARAAVLTALIAINVAVWGLLMFGIVRVLERARVRSGV
ncbi:MAG TPA: hypothetical protein VFL80_02455 [Thermoanaerobaculia bacterium]|nr:hypothetical protein [Thermoanaerobaculia bacterium]